MNVLAEKENKKQQFLSRFSERELSTDTIAGEAKEALKTLEFPTTRNEYWKYTRLGQLINSDFTRTPTSQVDSIEKYIIPGLNAYLAVFIDGVYSNKLSDIESSKDINIKPIARARLENPELIKKHYGQLADHKTQIFTSINALYNENGVFIEVKNNAVPEKPLHVINLTSAENMACHPRNLFLIGKNAEASVIQTYETFAGDAFFNVVNEIYIAENANFNTFTFQNQGTQSKQINTTEVLQEANSNYTATTITMNTGLVRNNHNVKVVGQGAITNLFGLYLTNGKEHVDNHTLIDHIVPNCTSNEFYKGVMNGKSTGVFNGKVFVRQEAQKTNAFQQNQNILLSDNASVYSKPELEIYADDVKCSHGSTTGQLNEEAIFYLRSRGISELSARRIMIQAFAHETLKDIKIEPFKELIEQRITENFQF